MERLLVRNSPFATGISAEPIFEVNIQPDHLLRLSFLGQDIGVLTIDCFTTEAVIHPCKLTTGLGQKLKAAIGRSQRELLTQP